MVGGSRGQLPSDVAGLIGRDVELAQIGVFLGRTRLLTLTGIGGVGKSRLAVQAGRQLTRTFPGGAWLVELALIRDPQLILGAVARALGLQGSGRQLEVRVAARLQRGRSSLLILDNCEHLKDACAELAHALLERVPDLRILATSREPLGLLGEVTLPVPPLDVPDEYSDHAFEDALNFSAVGLFVERATAADPTFAPSSRDTKTITEICRRVAGIPLGLELAAVRVRTLTLEEVLLRLNDQLAWPNPDRRTAANRHETLAATLRWSHELMSDLERVCWRRLSVFVGGFGLAAGEAVCCSDDIHGDRFVDVLTGLIEKSIVIANHQEQESRYRILEPVRLYGRMLLGEAGEEQAVLRRHRDWLLQATAGDSPWWSGGNQLMWLKQVDMEHANICAAADFSMSATETRELALVQIEQIAHAWLLQGWYAELLLYLERLLADIPGPSPVWARALYATGIAYWLRGEYDDARSQFRQCLALAGRKRAYELERGLGQYGLGLVELLAGEVLSARRHLETAIELFDRAHAHVMHAAALLFCSETYISSFVATTTSGSQEEIAKAVALIEQALAETATSGDAWNLARGYYVRGSVSFSHLQLSSAHDDFLAAAGLQVEIGHQRGLVASLTSLASVAVATHQEQRAAHLLGACDAIVRRTDVEPYPKTATDYAANEEKCRAAVGDARYERFHRAGQNFTVQGTLEYAAGAEATDAKHTSISPLSERETKVTALIASGATNREIAQKLFISENTVKYHVRNLMGKLGCRSRAEIAAWHARVSGSQTRLSSR